MKKKGIITATLIGSMILGSTALGLAQDNTQVNTKTPTQTQVVRGFQWYGYRWQINTETNIKALAKTLSISEQQTKELLTKLNNNPMMLINAKAIANLSGKSLNEVVNELTKYNAYYYITQTLKIDIYKLQAESERLLTSFRANIGRMNYLNMRYGYKHGGRFGRMNHPHMGYGYKHGRPQMQRGLRGRLSLTAISKALSLSEQQTKELLSKLNNNPMMLINAKAIANLSGKSLNGVVNELTKYNAYYYITNVLNIDQNKFQAEKIKLLNSIR